MVVTGVGPHRPVATCGRCVSMAEEAGLPRSGVWLPALPRPPRLLPCPRTPDAQWVTGGRKPPLQPLGASSCEESVLSDALAEMREAAAAGPVVGRPAGLAGVVLG